MMKSNHSEVRSPLVSCYGRTYCSDIPLKSNEVREVKKLVEHVEALDRVRHRPCDVATNTLCKKKLIIGRKNVHTNIAAPREYSECSTFQAAIDKARYKGDACSANMARCTCHSEQS
jgi:hypothetical protein